MKSDEKQRLLTKENLPIESIGQQDLHTAKTTLEQLQSWINVLELFDQFFNCKQSPLNKEKIILKYHATAQIFGIFFEDFLKHTDILENQLDALKAK